MAFWDNLFKTNKLNIKTESINQSSNIDNRKVEQLNNYLESIRITKNSNDEQGLYYNPLKSIKNILSSDGNISTYELNQFRLLKTERVDKYNSYDVMGQDSRVGSILNMYADDCTQSNQSSKIIWAESSDTDCAAFVNRIIDNIQLNKHVWSHIYSLCKYGDLYLELFYDDELNEDYHTETDINEYEDTPELTQIYQRKAGARLVEHIESVKNPANIFDLVYHSKTMCYVKVTSDDQNNTINNSNMGYMYQTNEDSIILPADKFVHICINDANTRFPNKYILKNDETGEESVYDIKEGTSILANAFKTWSELNLLEDSVLLNRLSKSAIIRLIQVDVGNTDDDEIDGFLKSLRDKISRSRYLDKSNGTYKNQVNPGPLENIIYHATHDGKGVISHSTIGGDVEVKALADIDHFLEKFAQSFPIPKAMISQKNDDGGGLSAGTSLAKFDAQHGRTLKRYQSAYISGITDLINVFAYKRGVTSYINNFNIKMVSPSAIEDNERDEKLAIHTDMIRDIMDIIQKEEKAYNVVTRKTILNHLIQSMLQITGLNEILDEDFNKTKETLEKEMKISDEESMNY